MSLYLKHRPTKLDDIVGNKEVTEPLAKLLKQKKAPHSFLLTGPTGCGKTTLARIIANQLGCKGSDLKEIDSADFRGIDTIRNIRKNSMYKALDGNRRVWIIDECHKMTNDAQNAMLKILEDTPPHVYFILCTTDPQKLLKTVVGRCSQFKMNILSENKMVKLLKQISKKEKEKVDLEVLERIAMDSGGHPRNALQILEQVLLEEPKKRLNYATQIALVETQSIELSRALIKSGTGWKEVRLLLQGLKKQEPETIRRQVLGYCSAVLLNKDNNRVGLVMEEFIEPFYNSGFSGLVLACFTIIKS